MHLNVAQRNVVRPRRRIALAEAKRRVLRLKQPVAPTALPAITLSPIIPAAQSIGCILTAYNRVHNIAAQLRALNKQTVQPAEILIWHNGDKVLPQSTPASKQVQVVHATPNMGVWPRFLIGMELHTKYVCVFDDDTIPGPGWLENCLKHMQDKEGLYGTVGIRFNTVARGSYTRVGWPAPNTAVEEVDLVGHSWFFKRDWLRYYALEPRQSGPTCGEDYHFSVALQKHLNIATYVPPHNPECKDMWGSVHGELGRDNSALYKQPGERQKKIQMHNAYLASGWKPMVLRYDLQ